MADERRPDYVRFLCVYSVTSHKHEYSRQFGRGAIADLSEEIWPGLLLADVVRPGTFERIEADPPPEFELTDDDESNDEE